MQFEHLIQVISYVKTHAKNFFSLKTVKFEISERALCNI